MFVIAVIVVLFLDGTIFTSNKYSISPQFTAETRTIKSFYSAILPDVLKFPSWQSVIRGQLLCEYDILLLNSSYSIINKILQIIKKFGQLLSFIFLNTVITTQLYYDNGSCQQIDNKQSCINSSTNFQIRKILLMLFCLKKKDTYTLNICI